MKHDGKKLIFRGLFAGLMIGIGCTVYLACQSKLAGALLFSAGLFFILSNDGALFTGMCGLKTPWGVLAAVLGLNACGTLLAGLLTWPANYLQTGASPTLTTLAYAAREVVLAKTGASPAAWLTNGILCGMLMYLAVTGYKKAQDGARALASLLYAIPVFIIAGFEHSIADMGYLAIAMPMMSGASLLKALGMIAVVVIGNVIGSKVLRVMLVDAQES